MSGMVVLYVVVDRNRNIRKNRHRSFMIYGKQRTAERQCKDGDAVVEAFIDYGREPLHIRGEVLDGGDG